MSRYTATELLLVYSFTCHGLYDLNPKSTASTMPQRKASAGAKDPSLNSQKISDNPQVNKWVENYLGIGEWVMDQSVAVLGSSGYFERRR
ncbi:hypothetical protein AJ79_07468 [Helicocarpus griseus UAMH5409]|uniref:Uncharacterized protein n=1 Tax=Helicocarpus griseus UAMH5409 TaxID=1447875 RepID=A0A2B7X1W3_9EURO|nr:hypothetical protein AJ79_07468 [Helicocarpus griseus UAMH5409]